MNSYLQTVLADEPSALWLLSETSGIHAIDATGHGYTGNLYGTITMNGPVLVANLGLPSMLFDGSTAYIQAPSTVPFYSSAWSFEGWLLIQNMSDTNYSRWISTDNPTISPYQGFDLGAKEDVSYFWVEAGNGSTGSIAASSGNHPAEILTPIYIAATYDNANLRIYRNGVLIATAAIAAASDIGRTSLIIGGSPVYGGGMWKGAIAAVAAYPYTLTGQQIINHYAAGLTPPQGVSVLMGPAYASNMQYMPTVDSDTLHIVQTQGSTLPTVTMKLFDPQSVSTIESEDECIVVQMGDPNGFPTVNLLKNPSFEGTYSAGLAPNWAATKTGTGITYQSSGTTKYGSESQNLVLANAGSGLSPGVSQYVILPVNEQGNQLLAQAYTFSVYVSVATAFSGISGGTLAIEWLNNVGSEIGAAVTTIPLTWLQYGQVWTRWSVIGMAPTGTVTCYARLYVTTNNATNAGSMLIDGAQLEYQTFGEYLVSASQTADNGYYPTPFTDPTSSAVHIDLRNSLYYRQLRLFGGFIRTITDDYTEGPERWRQCDGVGYGIILQEAPCTQIFQNQTDTAAIAQAVTGARQMDSALLAGLDYTTYVQSITTVNYFVINWNTVQDAMDKIANQTQAAYYVDAYLMLHYAPDLATSAAFALSSDPDMVNTFPFSNFSYVADSTGSFSTMVVEGSTQLSAPQTYNATGNGTATSFVLFNSAQVTEVDSATVGGVAQTVGLYSVNTYGQGYGALLDPSSGTLYFQTAPSSGVAIVVIFRFNSPVLERLTNTTNATTLRRHIHHYEKHQHISSQQSAYDYANAMENRNGKAKPQGTIDCFTNVCPVSLPLQAGTAIQVTHSAAGFSNTLFQIQKLTITVIGTIIRYELGIGWYHPNFILSMKNVWNQLTAPPTAANSSTVLNTLQSAGPDGWAVTDSISAPSVSNIGTWDGTSTWDGTDVWG